MKGSSSTFFCVKIITSSTHYDDYFSSENTINEVQASIPTKDGSKILLNNYALWAQRGGCQSTKAIQNSDAT